MKGRDSALFNGMVKGISFLFFGGAVVFYAVEKALEDLEERLAAQAAEINAKCGLVNVEVTTPDPLLVQKVMFVCIILGIIALAIGIGAEAYQRAKQSSKKEETD